MDTAVVQVTSLRCRLTVRLSQRLEEGVTRHGYRRHPASCKKEWRSCPRVVDYSKYRPLRAHVQRGFCLRGRKVNRCLGYVGLRHARMMRGRASSAYKTRVTSTTFTNSHGVLLLHVQWLIGLADLAQPLFCRTCWREGRPICSATCCTSRSPARGSCWPSTAVRIHMARSSCAS